MASYTSYGWLFTVIISCNFQYSLSDGLGSESATLAPPLGLRWYYPKGIFPKGIVPVGIAMLYPTHGVRGCGILYGIRNTYRPVHPFSSTGWNNYGVESTKTYWLFFWKKWTHTLNRTRLLHFQILQNDRAHFTTEPSFHLLSSKLSPACRKSLK